jgi:Lrp/AsnC family transcriptional regulator, leucine-responsive regulatory protein
MARREAHSSAPVELDDIDRRLVLTLSRNGRRSAAALAKDLGLSRQAVTERMRSLQERGVILGYRADVDPLALGLAIRAQIRLALDGTATPQKEKDVLRMLIAHPMVRAVSRVSGEDCFVADVVCRSIEDVNALLAEIKQTRAIQSSRTAFVLEQILDRKGLGALEPSLIAQAVAAE